MPSWKQTRRWRPGRAAAQDMVKKGGPRGLAEWYATVAAGGAGTDGDQPPGHLPDPLDPFDLPRCGHRALNERHVVRALDNRSGGLREIGDLDGAGQRNQFVLAVQQGQLAAVTRGELPYREFGPGQAVVVGDRHGYSSARVIRDASRS